MAVSTIDNSGISPSAAISTSKLGTGAVLQVVSTFKSDTFSTASGSMVDITGMSVSITPSSSTNKILVLITLTVGPAANNFAPVNLVRNGTNIAQPTTASAYQATLNNYPGEGGSYSSAFAQPLYALNYLDSPATTSALTYKLQMYSTSGTAYVNARAGNQNGTCTSSITVMEIAA